MPTTVLYRINGGEVIKISEQGQLFDERNITYWGVVTDPNFPDGADIWDENEDIPELRILGFAKIFNGVDTVRNATQAEIDNFALAEDEDEKQQDADGAVEILEIHPRFRKLMIACASILVDEFNILRKWDRDFKNEVSQALNLSNFKTRVGSLPDLNDRSLSQLKTAIKNRISKDD